jgi:hypothetical protein
MTNQIDFGTQGAKVQTWSTKQGARSLLARIVEERADADDEVIFHAFSSECAAFFPEIVRYWVANNLKALRPRQIGSSVDRIAAAQTPKERAAQAERIARKVAPRILDFAVGDKMLRDCTFAECAKNGGWLSRISKLGQPNEKVGAVLTEKQIKAALKG